jgi:hypothetical protein
MLSVINKNIRKAQNLQKNLKDQNEEIDQYKGG